MSFHEVSSIFSAGEAGGRIKISIIVSTNAARRSSFTAEIRLGCDFRMDKPDRVMNPLPH
jgi:hypothetical protein